MRSTRLWSVLVGLVTLTPRVPCRPITDRSETIGRVLLALVPDHAQ